MINPLLIDFHDNIRNCILGTSLLIAIPYGYINPKALKGFDGALNLFDNGENMVSRINTILSKSVLERAGSSEITAMSDREKEIIYAVACGKTNREIAGNLGLSIHTVISHRNNICKKIGVKGAAGLTLYAVQHHLVI